jgi:SAM-dependent methyltransferase
MVKKINNYEKSKKFYWDVYWKSGLKNNPYGPNGFQELPQKIYQIFSQEIDKNGNVLDLGCGNGLMLKYLIETSGHKLIPYGADFMEPAIKQAKEIFHPEHSGNFFLGNIIDYPFKKNFFNFIFTAPHHVLSKDREKYLKNIWASCKKNGKIIFYQYSNGPGGKSGNGFGNFSEIKNLKLIRKSCPEISLAIWQK